jgi:two-component system response regulator RegX3
MRVLIVEDEPTLREGLTDLLRGDGHEVEAVGDGEAAMERGWHAPFDLVLLDLMLPRLDGLSVCQRLREARPGLLILMLTARGSEADKVRGLLNGADDYVTKPFGARELLARVRAMGRRAQAMPTEPERLDTGHGVLDLSRCVLERPGLDVPLTVREVGILRWLYRHRGRAVTRSELLEQVWCAPGDLETRTVDMAIANLRKKIEPQPAQPRVVVSVKGVGYAWGGPDQAREG